MDILKMMSLRDLSRGLKNSKRKKKDDSDSNSDHRPLTTEKLQKSIVYSLTSGIKDAAKFDASSTGKTDLFENTGALMNKNINKNYCAFEEGAESDLIASPLT
jgi:hypothetical protein